MVAGSINKKSVHVGLDGVSVSGTEGMGDFATTWTWVNSLRAGGVATIEVPAPGVHYLDVWMREDGFILDRILLTTDPAYVPSGEGPAASGRAPATGAVAAPVPSVADGAFVPAGTSVVLYSPTPGAEIHYTLDGSVPDAASPVYDAPIPINGPIMVRARAIKTGLTGSTELIASYNVLEGAWQQGSGPDAILVVPAGGYAANIARSPSYWGEEAVAGALGTALKAMPNAGHRINDNYRDASPQLRYVVEFAQAGTHYVWVRGLGAGSGDDSVHVGLSGEPVVTANRITGFGTGWTWARGTMDGPVATIDVPGPGRYTLDVWMREDGFIFDRLLLTTNPNYVPEGDGPDASVQVP